MTILKIEITSKQLASPNGIRVKEYLKGEVYTVPSPDMSRDLAAVFLEQEWASVLPPEPTPDEDKSLNVPLEYKAMKVDQLKEEAEKAGIEGFEKLKKGELIEALEKKDAELAEVDELDVLRKIAEEAGIEGFADLDKEALVAALEQKKADPTPADS